MRFKANQFKSDCIVSVPHYIRSVLCKLHNFNSTFLTVVMQARTLCITRISGLISDLEVLKIHFCGEVLLVHV